MPIITSLDWAEKLNQFLDVDLAWACAQSTELDRPRPRFPTAIGLIFRLIFREPPFVKVVVTRDEVFGREFYTPEFEGGIKRIVQGCRFSPNRGRQKG